MHKTVRTDRGPKEKSFRQFRWSGDKWVSGLDGGPLYLYGLPALIKAAKTEPERWVHIAEGEKKAERLNQLGFLATCNAMGASGWRAEYAECLRDRNVAVLEDNDEAGRKWGNDVIASLQGRARCVKRVSFAELPEHGDVCDWLAQGHTADELAELVEEAPVAEVHAPGRGIDFMSKSGELKDVSWLWPGWIPMGAVTVICGRPEAGKSKLWLELVERLARRDLCWPDGQPQGDLPEGVRPVALYLDTEAMQHATSKRIEGKGLDRVPGFKLLCVEHPDEPGSILATHNLRDEKSRDSLIKTVQVEHPAIVVIDSLGGAVAGGKENEADTMAPLLQLLAKIARDHVCAVLIIAHPRKGVEQGAWGEIGLEDIRGSSVIGQFARSVLVIDDPDQTEVEKPDDIRRRRLRSVKSSFDMKPKALGLRHSSASSLEFDLDAPRRPMRKSKLDQAAEWLRDQLSDEPHWVTELMDRAKADGHRERTVLRAKEKVGVVSRQEPNSEGQMRHRWYLRARANERAESETGRLGGEE